MGTDNLLSPTMGANSGSNKEGVMIDNERQARWVGFKYHSYEVYEYEHKETRVEDPYWTNPKGRRCLSPPDFPHDIKACFDHLEPELYRRGYLYMMSRFWGRHYVEISHPVTGSMVSAFDNEPAQAFCEAVGKLMDSEEGKNGSW